MPRLLSATRRLAAAVAGALVIGLVAVVPQPAGATGPRVDVVVQLRADPGRVAVAAADHAGRYGARVRHVYRHALTGYAASIPAARLGDLRRDPTVVLVEPDTAVRAMGTPWHLDRIDQQYLPLDGKPYSGARGRGVTAYVVDSGIWYPHPELGGRAVPGYDAFGGDGSDCNGHGTHVAGLLGGATVGAAQQVRLVSVRVLDCTGSATTSRLIAGIDWIVGNHVAGMLAVANVSVGGPASSAVDTAVRTLVAEGVPVAAAADVVDSCSVSPARVAEVMTTGATDMQDRAFVLGDGGCVDWYAPGVGVRSAWLGGAYLTMSGTSAASPLTAAAAAMLLAANPWSSAASVHWSVASATTKDVVQPPTLPNNDMLYVGSGP